MVAALLSWWKYNSLLVQVRIEVIALGVTLHAFLIQSEVFSR